MEISTTDLVKEYRGRKVVNGISINIQQGEIVGLLGPNGAGKTTTFYMIVGLVKPTRGHVLFDGNDVTRQPMYRRARNGIAYLPQEASVFRNLTVEENLHLVLQMQNLTKAQRKERADRLLEELHITRIRHDLGKTLSGGERRRVEIARALASEPKFILLDEPFTGVDPKAIDDIATIIRRLTKSEEKIGILITDHNVEAMLSIMERVYLIADGEKRYEGPSTTLLNDPAAQEAYFGQSYGLHRDMARIAAEEELRRMSHEYDTELDEMEMEQEPDPGKRKEDDDAAA
ncbi:MAG: ABC-type (unclassified) transport system, ATPase component [Chthonomonadaceae bacterium]|nr:ABC-type (unclassified) transport system, ATPase component [Chthonomonadaceae bacterium]